MKSTELKQALNCAVKAARAAGAVMRQNRHRAKQINSQIQHDIKLELDVRCQKLIEKKLLDRFPQISVLGEEGVRGDLASPLRWVVDPIDGTVNFAYGIPHACVSIALQRRIPNPRSSRRKEAQRFKSGISQSLLTSAATKQMLREVEGVLDDDAAYETVVGVVYDPFCDELWTAILGSPARLNGTIIHPSARTRMDHAIVSLGFAKSKQSLETMLPTFHQLIHRVRKVRIMGAAALAIVYVASGRFDAYIESGLRLWDIAAGGLILECAGGDFCRRQLPGEHSYAILANNGPLRRKLQTISKTKAEE